MGGRDICISKQDKARLSQLIEQALHTKSESREHLRSLQQELDRAELRAPKNIPPDVITMNSTVRLTDLDTGEEMIVSLVFPNEADLAAQKISVLAPVGTAILGYRVGDTIEWRVPAGIRRLHVNEILFQPEAAGRFDL